MIVITSIQQIKKDKKKVCLSNGADFVLYNKEVYCYSLEEEQELTTEQYQQLLEEVFFPRAKRRAMHLLEKMDRSERQLREKLRLAGYPQEAIEEAIAYVVSYHYLDDERMARSFIRYYQTSRSKLRIQQDLMQKGIAKDVIARCLEEEYETSQMELIQRLLEKKHYNREEATREEKSKLYRFLLQKGFSSNDIRSALGEHWEM